MKTTRERVTAKTAPHAGRLQRPADGERAARVLFDVKSAPGPGSAFTIYLPRSAVTLATAESGQATPP